MQPLIVPGRLDSLENIRKYVTLAAKNAGLEKARAYKLRLAVDEIATNIVNYGYARAGLEGVISVEADLDEHALTIALDDTSGYYDPTLRSPPPPEYFNQPLEERGIGGWGVYLAIQSVDQFHYQRVKDHNRNIFIMDRATHGDLLLIDSQQDCVTVTQHLVSLGYTVTCVENGQKAFDLLQEKKVEMALLALPMQDGSAEEFIKKMKADNALRGIPLIVLADRALLDEAVSCIQAGAEDYIVLPFSPVVLKARISANLERQRVRLAEQTFKNVMKNELEVQIGQQIQLNFLPEKLPQAPGWEIAARFEPAQEVAGDFYDSFGLKNNHISLVMGDVCDKGITAALFMTLFRSLLRAFIQVEESDRLIDPLNGGTKDGSSLVDQGASPFNDSVAIKKAIELTNHYILNNHHSTNMFATIFLGVLDPESGMLTYINAGHEPPLIVTLGKVRTRLKRTGLAVGMMPDGDYEIQQTQLDLGDTLLIYTDGVTEAKNPSGETFGRKRLLEILEKPGLTATALIKEIETSLRAHIMDAAQGDDITMLAVRRLA